MEFNDLNNELQQNFIEYAVAVNTDRAIPDAKSGLKPVARRILWDAYDEGYTSNHEHVKCANIVGSTMARFHPHGDSSIYGALVNLSQPWVMRYPLIDFHGNMGNISGDGPAAYRYTNARLAKIAEDGLLANIKKRNVNFVPNYDENDEEPITLPAIFPNLLCNPNLGIGVAISCHFLTHNLSEVANAIYDYMEGKEPTLPGPDFPTGGLIINGNELPKIIACGKGAVKVRAKYRIEKNKIIYYEIPYETTLEELIKEIGALAEQEIEDIIDVHDESNKKGVRIVVECRKGSNIETVVKKIFAKTNMQKSINYNQVALVNKVPTELGLKDCIKIYLSHNIDCLIKEINFDKEKSLSRLEIINGLLKALEDIDNIINLIKKAESSKDACNKLIEKYSFSTNQAQAIVNMKLGSLAGLEKIELQNEKAELTNKLLEYEKILSSQDRQYQIIRERLSNIVKKYGDKRRTEIIQLEEKEEEKAKEEIPSEDVIVIFNNDGYVKRIPQKSIKVQRRGGKGSKTKEESVLTSLTTNTQNYLFIFTKKGKMYKLLVNDIPANENTHVGNLIGLDSDDSLIAVSSFSLSKYIVFFTKKGYIKKSLIDDYKNVKRKTGITAIKLQDGDSIVNVEFMNDEEVMLISKCGLAVKVETKDIAPIGRNAIGVKGMKLQEQDYVIAASAIRDSKNECIGTFTENGYGKMTRIDEFYTQGRNGKGVFVYKPSEETGKLVSALVLTKDDNILIIGQNNTVSIAANDIPVTGRMTTGVIVTKDNKIKSVMKI